MTSLRNLALFGAFAVSSLAAPLAPTIQRRDPTCTNGVYVIAARGTDDSHMNATAPDPSYTDLRNLANIGSAIIDVVGDGYVEAVPYPATAIDYFTSLATGVSIVHDMITNYMNTCNGQVQPQIVLLGSSQGAEVMSGVLLLDDILSYKRYITATIFADPSSVPGYGPYDAGNATQAGIFAKTADQMQYLQTHWSDNVRSFCQDGDIYCASGTGPDGPSIHSNEQYTYADEAYKFLVAQLG